MSSGIVERDVADTGSFWRTAVAVVGILLLFVLGSLVSRALYPDRPLVVHELSGPTMGTTWTAKVVAPAGATALVAVARDSITARLDRVELSMSTWNPESEISRFNRFRSVEPYPVSAEFIDVVRRGEVVSIATGGAFDVTVAPLVVLWGFGAGGTPGHPAEPADLASALAHVGFSNILLSNDGRSLSKTDPDVSIDLSAIAKGYGVDRAAEALSSIGLAAYAIEVGGEVRARGRKPDGSPWLVGIEAPNPTARSVLRSIPLYDASVATSGDYRNFFESNGVRYAHIVDPRTGSPIPWLGFSVTVIHTSATMADAWATGLSVLGPEEGIALADREGLAVLYVLPDSVGGYREVRSAAWESEVEAGDTESAAARDAIPPTRGITAAGIS
ncbi:MAG: FAD:protein FMN transferase [Gemmatimonadota bacterium]